MSRTTPPELKRKSWIEGTVWELLAAADLLPYRHSSQFGDLGMTKRERRELWKERELLRGTRTSYILPQPGTERRSPQPWLFVKAERGGYYRVGETGEIDRFGTRTLNFGSGSITERDWYPATVRGVRWLQLVAIGRHVQTLQRQEAQAASCVALAPLSAEAADREQPAEQLRLFPEQ